MSIGSVELELHVNNDPTLCKQKMAIAKTIATHKARGNYDRDKALKVFTRHLAIPAAKSYAKEFGGKWNALFTISDRQDFARDQLAWFNASWKAGEFESIIPKKYQKAATKKKAKAAMVVAAKRRNNSIGEYPRANKRGPKKGRESYVEIPLPAGKTVIGPSGYDESYISATVDSDGHVQIYDDVADHYVAHHDLTSKQLATARRLAGVAANATKKRGVFYLEDTTHVHWPGALPYRGKSSKGYASRDGAERRANEVMLHYSRNHGGQGGPDLRVKEK